MRRLVQSEASKEIVDGYAPVSFFIFLECQRLEFEIYLTVRKQQEAAKGDSSSSFD